MNEFDVELSVCPVLINKPKNKSSVSSISRDMTVCKLPASLVSVNVVSVCPVSTYESDCELSASLASLHEMSTSPVSVDAPVYAPL